MPYGDITFRTSRLFCSGGYGIKTDIGEKNNRSPSQHADWFAFCVMSEPAKGHEGILVGRIDVEGGKRNEYCDGQEFNQNHYSV